MFYTRTIREYEVRPTNRPFLGSTFGTSFNSQYGSAWGWQSNYCYTPAANVLELDDRYLLEIALPGVVLDDVELKAEQYFISIHAKRLPSLFEEQAFIHLQELPFSGLMRYFEFSEPILSEQVEARMDRGILYISAPKLEVAHRIPVSAGTIEGRLPGIKTQVSSKSEVARHSGKETVVK